MDPELGDLDEADVLVRDGAVVAVGPGLSARGAMVIDARGMIALPGLVDTH
jgi:imidazolonepropionase-like amidohydrolase